MRATDAPRREESSVARWRRRASVYFVGMRLQRALVVLERQPAGWNFEPNARAGVELKAPLMISETWPGVSPRAVG